MMSAESHSQTVLCSSVRGVLGVAVQWRPSPYKSVAWVGLGCPDSTGKGFKSSSSLSKSVCAVNKLLMDSDWKTLFGMFTSLAPNHYIKCTHLSFNTTLKSINKMDWRLFAKLSWQSEKNKALFLQLLKQWRSYVWNVNSPFREIWRGRSIVSSTKSKSKGPQEVQSECCVPESLEPK